MNKINTIPQLASLASFSPDSRVWVYVINRTLTDAESGVIQQELDLFCHQWTAHNQALQAVAEIFEGQFVLLMVDETRAGASGCSIDKSVHFLEQLGAAMNVDFFERMRFAWVAEEGHLQYAGPSALSEAVKSNQITDTTLMVNTLVQSKRDLAEKWLVPFSKSWHRRISAAH